MTVDEALSVADEQDTLHGMGAIEASRVLAAEVRRLREENKRLGRLADVAVRELGTENARLCARVAELDELLNIADAELEQHR